MDHKKPTIFDYREPLSEFALWWQSFFLLPVWAMVLLLPVGVIVRSLHSPLEPYFVVGYMTFFFSYFLYRLSSRQLTIDDTYVRLGWEKYKISDLKSITTCVTGLMYNGISLNFDDGKVHELKLSLHTLSPDNAQSLVDILSRRISGLTVDSKVERFIKAGQPLAVDHIPNPDEVILDYRMHGFIQDLPEVFDTTVISWSKLVGPVWTLILSSPFWILATIAIFNALRDYDIVGNNWTFYETLATILLTLTPQAATTASISLESWLAFYPVACAVWMLLFGFVYQLIKLSLSPNKITLNRDEIALDWWSYLYSVEKASVKWTDVKKIKLVGDESASADKWQIKIEHGHNQTLNLELGAIKVEERPKLLKSLQEFAGRNTMDSEVAETLTPRAAGSYTELWLQSLSDTTVRKNLEPLDSQSRLQDGRYEIVEKLGIGGEGTAYKALDRQELWEGKVTSVVLKETIIAPYLDRAAEREAINRIQSESQILSSIESDLVVKCLDFFIEDKRCYLVLEYIDGQNLRNVVKQNGPLSEVETLQIALKMCDVLEVLHGKQIIHRDFTPDNLMYNQSGQIKLIDFAVATEDRGGTTGTIVGKHSYVPPEQFRGHAVKASDIYAMGATLYFLLTGLDPEPIAVSHLDKSKFSDFVSEMVESMTSQDSSKRPADIIALRQSIEEHLHSILDKFESDKFKSDKVLVDKNHSDGQEIADSDSQTHTIDISKKELSING